ncbi:Molybdenum cofactor synthesis 2 [Mycena kentingensis (nom. inval.)]|nr:Molybdenum cofactor synthesis 2 [Mycena kentingensis (nom. inval.)]
MRCDTKMDSTASVEAKVELANGVCAPSVEAQVELANGICALSYTLDTQKIIDSVADDRAGGIAVFIGVTRKDNLNGKVVARLEYQAYSKLAIKTMVKIVEQVHAASSSPSVGRYAVHHRLGAVPIGEPSIIIAVSAPRRKAAFVACEQILEDVKAQCQIWKREFYENEGDDAAEWKANRS